MPQLPLILVTNDDGIWSEGIKILASELKAVGQVIVAAPSSQQSAVSHCISLSQPLRIDTIKPGWHAISGTPADSVFLGVHTVCDRKPDLVVSGINLGANVGSDVFYSGTLAGALEAVLRGVPSFAISQQLPFQLNAADAEKRSEEHPAALWDSLPELGERLRPVVENTARFAAALARSLLKNPLPLGMTLNVNAPPAETGYFAWTKLGGKNYRGRVESRRDPRGIPYYWIGGPVEPYQHPVGTDSHALEQSWISVTPLSMDWTGDLQRTKGHVAAIELFEEKVPISSH